MQSFSLDFLLIVTESLPLLIYDTNTCDRQWRFSICFVLRVLWGMYRQKSLADFVLALFSFTTHHTSTWWRTNVHNYHQNPHRHSTAYYMATHITNGRLSRCRCMTDCKIATQHAKKARGPSAVQNCAPFADKQLNNRADRIQRWRPLPFSFVLFTNCFSGSCPGAANGRYRAATTTTFTSSCLRKWYDTDKDLVAKMDMPQ